MGRRPRRIGAGGGWTAPLRTASSPASTTRETVPLAREPSHTEHLCDIQNLLIRQLGGVYTLLAMPSLAIGYSLFVTGSILMLAYALVVRAQAGPSKTQQSFRGHTLTRFLLCTRVIGLLITLIGLIVVFRSW